MRKLIKVVLIGLLCATVPVVAITWIVMLFAGSTVLLVEKSNSSSKTPLAETSKANRPKGRNAEANPQEAAASNVIDQSKALEDSGVDWAVQFTGAIRDPNSLAELREAVRARPRLGLSVMNAQLDQLHLNAQSPKDQVIYGARIEKSIGLLLMYEGKLADAGAIFAKAEEQCKSAGAPASLRAELLALRGIVAMRRGESDNCIDCVGPSSCIFPIDSAAAHKLQTGSREAIEHFSRYLSEWPEDIRIRWLLNIAYMTVGEYPAKVPSKLLVPIDRFRSKIEVGRFNNVAPLVGLTSRGPNIAGGSVFDDFTGDGRPDIVTSALDADMSVSLYVNKGDGTFEDRSEAAGLKDQIYCLNFTRTDFDNDGDLDLLLLRGAWEKPMRMSLLRNNGKGEFEDVTMQAGLSEPISAESAAWGDFDNDGDLDVFVCGEYLPPGKDAATFKFDPRNRCRLYRNKGNGTFEDVATKVGLAPAVGVADALYAKGSAWGDYDNDGRLDLFISNMNGPCRLYHQESDGTFRNVAPSFGITADSCFACWMWDYDNDGRLDIYVNGKAASLADSVADALGLPGERPTCPHLYRNLGAEGFRDVTREVGLARPMTRMGCNFADIDNDGYLDMYFGTGGMSYSHLVPNLMFKNVDGKRFEDVTMSSGTGHLQKGHGTSFADFDDDGDLDLFVEAGGAAPGDKSFNLLFKNPGNARHWLKFKLVGTKSNRAAIGAKIRAEIKGPNGTSRTIYRTIGNNSSFGGNTLVELLGLGDATRVSELEITWPRDGKKQVLKDVKADQAIVVTESAP